MSISPEQRRVVLAICGASGVIYGIRTLRALLQHPFRIHLCISDTGWQVLQHETDYSGDDFAAFLAGQCDTFHPEASWRLHDAGDLFAPIASGSYLHRGMLIAPCSMKTLAAVAAGLADTLIHRAADVCLKEKRPLLLMTRETPFSAIHLENMLRVTRAGAVIMPPCPGFYHRPESITEIVDATVARMLDQLQIPNNLMTRWGASNGL